MDGAERGEGLRFEVADCFEVLDCDAFIVLSAAREDGAIGGAVGGEGRVGPLVGFGGDGVEVGVEEDGREGGVGAGPREEEEGFAWGELEGLGFEV